MTAREDAITDLMERTGKTREQAEAFLDLAASAFRRRGWAKGQPLTPDEVAARFHAFTGDDQRADEGRVRKLQIALIRAQFSEPPVTFSWKDHFSTDEELLRLYGKSSRPVAVALLEALEELVADSALQAEE